ncbi:MAG TPA: argininosuccinate lyase [Candidatus Krumholzibacteria bacterium]|nr:argininosuccinate lyase [Candidatus Krumholzibacteria bacterium]
MSTLWQRDEPVDPWFEAFLAGEDRELDLQLVPHDCRASLVHARMLQDLGVLSTEELSAIAAILEEIREHAERGEFRIAPDEEDGHTAIENVLVARCGDAGKKIHTGRSRNDQVLTALRLWEKEQLAALLAALDAYVDALDTARARQGHVAMPGYTHMQAAMPTTVDVWLGSFAAAAADDRRYLELAQEAVDQCPLGTAAGFGVPVFALDRARTAAELGFARVQTNPLHAQLSRGRTEALLLSACGQAMQGLNRLAADLLLFSTREFHLVSLPEALCTGSSIMPQKRNADVLELVRGSLHVVLGEEAKIRTLTAGLMSGYNRDVQLSKGPLMNGVKTTLNGLRAMTMVLEGLTVDAEACAAALTDELYATERALTLVAQGVPFRDAYRRVAAGEKLRRNDQAKGA